jgi:hypothetical protein
MALSRFVVTAKITVTPDVAAAVVAGEGMTQNLFGSSPTASPGTVDDFGLWAGTYQPGTVIYADSSGPSSPPTGPQLLYQAIGSGNLRAFVDGQDDVGHAALAN